jgi:hypothetical protein
MLNVIRPHWTIVDFIGHEPEIVSIVYFPYKSGTDDLSTYYEVPVKNRLPSAYFQ